MSFFFNIVFLGFFLVLFGTSVLLNAFFNIKIPVGKVFGAMYLMFIGVNMLMGIVSQEPISLHSLKHAKQYRIAFGNQVIDLRNAHTKKNALDVQVAFGNATLILDPEVATTIHASSSFGSVSLPEQRNLLFGKRSSSFNSDKKQTMNVSLDVAFGSISVLQAPKVS